MEKMVEFYLDPYTGEKLGERSSWSGPSLERKNIMSFLYRLHFALALPWSWSAGAHSVGDYILGVTALVWTSIASSPSISPFRCGGARKATPRLRRNPGGAAGSRPG